MRIPLAERSVNQFEPLRNRVSDRRYDSLRDDTTPRELSEDDQKLAKSSGMSISTHIGD